MGASLRDLLAQVHWRDQCAGGGFADIGDAMTVPTLFLRASEVGEKPTHLETGEVPRKPDLLVPQVRPGLEFILRGYFQVDFADKGAAVKEPVRAFEIIAGEEGRVHKGQLFRRRDRILATDHLLQDDGWWSLVCDETSDAPWREAWERLEYLAMLEQRMTVFPEGPCWLVGPSTHGNFYGLSRHALRRQRPLLGDLMDPAGFWHKGDPPHFERLRAYLEMMPYWGIEFRLGEEPVAQVLREEMGL